MTMQSSRKQLRDINNKPVFQQILESQLSKMIQKKHLYKKNQQQEQIKSRLLLALQNRFCVKNTNSQSKQKFNSFIPGLNATKYVNLTPNKHQKSSIRETSKLTDRFKNNIDIQKFSSSIDRRQTGNGRLNKMFTQKTPTLKDQDIINRINQYSQKLTDKKEEETLEDQNNPYYQKYKFIHQKKENTTAYLLKDIEQMTKNIDKSLKQDNVFKNKHIKNLVQQNYRIKQMETVFDIFQEIQDSDPYTINGIFNYRLEEEIDKLAWQHDAMIEYKTGKFDLQNLQNQRKMQIK